MTKSFTPRFSLLVGLALIASLCISSCATKPGRKGPPPDRQGKGGPTKTSGTYILPVAILFASMDVNNDKVTSLIEMQKGAQSEWETFERNPSATYFSQWSIANLGSIDAMPTFMSFDRDFNGSISEEEFVNQLSSEFRRLDRNRDGQLQRSEMIIAFEAPRSQQSRNGSGQERGGKGGKGGGRNPR